MNKKDGEREARLAAALRENLRRRKAQARGTAQGAPERSETPFALSSSKGFPSSPPVEGEGEGFDKLSPNGGE